MIVITVCYQGRFHPVRSEKPPVKCGHFRVKGNTLILHHVKHYLNALTSNPKEA